MAEEVKNVSPTPEESTPQGATRRWPWSPKRVQEKPTWADRKAFKRLVDGQ